MDFASLKQKLTTRKLLLAAGYGVLVGIILYGAIAIFHGTRYLPVLLLLLLLILVLAEVLWLNRERLMA